MGEVQAIQTRLKPVFQKYNIDRALLFGSYAKGQATNKSDIDLYVDSNLRGMEFVGLMEEVRQALGNKDIDLLNTSHIEKDSPIAQEIQKTGVIIYER